MRFQTLFVVGVLTMAAVAGLNVHAQTPQVTSPYNNAVPLDAAKAMASSDSDETPSG